MNKACARAPVRVDPAGGGTDAPPFCIEHGGLVVNLGVSKHAYATVDRLPAGNGVTIWSHDLQQGVTAECASELPTEQLEFLQAFVRRLVPNEDSVLLVTDTDTPPGAGLGGSGALGVAVVAAIERAYGREHSPADIARLSNEIERIDLGYPGGDQDSFGAALGGFNKLERQTCGTTIPHRLNVPDEFRLIIEQNSLLVYTAEAHISGNIHQDIIDSYRKENSSTLAAMFELRSAAEKISEALEKGDLEAYANAMATSCENLYRLHPGCNSESHRKVFRELDDLILAGKTCGAGGGGFIFVLVKPGRRRECVRAVERLGALVWPFIVDFEGVRSWETLATEEQEIRWYRKFAARTNKTNGSD